MWNVWRVVGPGGAGKSTFSAALGERTGLPVVHLDQEYWRPGWVEPDRDTWRRRQAELFVADRWIADGNYGATLDERFGRADTVVVIARPRLACLSGALLRMARNHGSAVQADGCPESFNLDFYRWIWNYHRDSRPRVEAALARHPHLDVVVLTSRAAMQQFLDGATAR